MPPGPGSDDQESNLSEDVFTEGSWEGKSATEIRQMLRDFDPNLDTFQEYRNKMLRIVGMLTIRGEPLEIRIVNRFAIRAQYLRDTIGQDEEESRRTLQASLAELLRTGENLPDADLRAEILLDLLSQYGGEGSMWEQLFRRSRAPTVASGGAGDVGSGPASHHAASTPEKSVKVDEEVPLPRVFPRGIGPLSPRH